MINHESAEIRSRKNIPFRILYAVKGCWLSTYRVGRRVPFADSRLAYILYGEEPVPAKPDKLHGIASVSSAAVVPIWPGVIGDRGQTGENNS